ncbi:MAG: hypothetical protein NTV37_02280 [Proteobacteria bacterium]|nr:hypothetical protein [Pseudomonadota bacterium]
MPDTYSDCPKCGYKFPQSLPSTAADTIARNWHERMQDFLTPKEQMDTLSFYGRCLLLVLLAWWSWKLFAYDYRSGEIGGSFMHNILLPIHEAGHVLFMPFGQWLTILGGSLFQLALPGGIAIAFIWINRDNFGAAIGLWWTSVSLIDLAPYIYDALRPQLILLGGSVGEDGPHDWIYLLDSLGQRANAQHWGALAHTLGGLVMLAALSWASAVLWRQRLKLSKSLSTD